MSQNILDLENRRKIYNYILKNPGLYIRQLSRIKAIPKSTLTYHLNFLKKQGFLEVKYKNGYARYFAAKKICEKDKKLLDLLRRDIPRTIILLFLISPGFSQAKMIKFVEYWKSHPSKIGIYLNIHQTTISYYFNKLLEMDIIEPFLHKKKTFYRLKNPELFIDLIITYKNSIIDKASYRIIKHIIEPENEVIDKYLNSFHKIFPHPYYV